MNKWEFGKSFLFILMGTMLISMLFSNGVFAREKDGKDLEELMEEGIDVNHSEAIDKVRNYVDNNVEQGLFASLHIDRNERELGIIVLSFTEELPQEMKNEIQTLIEEPAEVSFRVVAYTEEELIAKQREVNHAIFEEKVVEEDGIIVYHTSTDIINSVVEIGISPYNEETIQILHDYFGTDMIQVVEGQEVHLLMGEDSAESVDITADMEVAAEEVGFFTKILNWFRSMFS